MSSLSTSKTLVPPKATAFASSADAHVRTGLSQEARLGRTRLIAGLGLLLVSVTQAYFLLQFLDKATWFSLREASATSAFVNGAVGLLLLVSRRTAVAYTAAVRLLALAGRSLHLIVQGQSSCGCLPGVHVPPWASVAVAVTLLACVIGALPDRMSSARVATASASDDEGAR
jgi:hypothetical protein